MQFRMADSAHQHIAFTEQRALTQTGRRPFTGVKRQIDLSLFRQFGDA